MKRSKQTQIKMSQPDFRQSKSETSFGSFGHFFATPTITFTVPGAPMGKQRPRVTKRGFAYTPKKTVNYETLIKEMFANAFPSHLPYPCPIRMELNIFMLIPESTSKKRKAMMRSNELRPTKKPDLDNIIKVVADALNTIAYLDDKQIVSLSSEKFYSDRPRIEIKISEVV